MIEDIAMKLFAERGYNGVSLRDIGHAAEVKLGSLFYLYQEKQGLYDRVVLQAVEHFGTRIYAALEGITDPLDQIKALIRVLVREHVQESPEGQIIARELAEPRGGRFAIVAASMFHSHRQVLNPAIRAISDYPMTDDEAIRRVGQIINMVHAAARSQTMYLGAFGLKAQDADQLAEDLANLLLRGLLPRPDKSPN